MVSMPGLSELVIIFAVLVLLFGAKKLPALGGAIGESIRNFKSGIKDGDDTQNKTPAIKTPAPTNQIPGEAKTGTQTDL